jgi:hypothetical protein
MSHESAVAADRKEPEGATDQGTSEAGHGRSRQKPRGRHRGIGRAHMLSVLHGKNDLEVFANRFVNLS